MSNYNENNTETCASCNHFECRTSFCRVNPPVPVVITDSQGRPSITAVFPVIKKPDIDWCSLIEIE